MIELSPSVSQQTERNSVDLTAGVAAAGTLFKTIATTIGQSIYYYQLPPADDGFICLGNSMFDYWLEIWLSTCSVERITMSSLL